jgi:hypothetical protein
MEIYPAELFILIAWFCGPATIFALVVETCSFHKHQLFRSRRWFVALAYFTTILLVPIASVFLLEAGLGKSPLESQNSGFMIPWFWQSFLAAIFISAGVVGVTKLKRKSYSAA